MKRRLHRLVGKINALPMARRIFLMFAVLTIIPLALVTAFIYNNIRQAESNRVFYTANQLFSQAKGVLDSKGKYIHEVMDILFMNENLQRFVNNATPEYAMDYGRQLLDYTRIIKLAKGIEGREGIQKFLLYIPDSRIHARGNPTCISMDTIKDEPWFLHLAEEPDLTRWLSSRQISRGAEEEPAFIPVVRMVKDIKDFSRGSGIIRLDLSLKEIDKILGNAMASESSLAILYTEDEELIHAAGGSTEHALDHALAYRSTPGEVFEEGWTRVKVAGVSYLVRSERITATEWFMGVSIPMDEFHLFGGIRLEWLVLPLFLLLVTYLAAYLIARLSTIRLKALTAQMRHAGRGDLSLRDLSNSRDEISELERNFNQMMVQINSLMDDKFRMGEQIKTTELRFLQAQINPHFLYNTLDMISWFSYMGKGEELREAVSTLARFYKLSLSSGADEIPIRDELEHVRMYVRIQNMRYSGAIDLRLAADEGVLDKKIVKGTLQPIVENAIQHGIMEKTEKSGVITITAHFDQGGILISVTDDGVGISKEALRVLSGQHWEESASYGLRNVSLRLSTLYGEGFGLSFLSEPGQGARVEIHIPVRE